MLHKRLRQGHSVLSQTFFEIIKELEQFQSVEFYHVLKAINKRAYELANRASKLEHGTFQDKQAQSRVLIP